MKFTYKYRVKDKHQKDLNIQTEWVNFVWNYCNETQKKAVSYGRKWLTAYDLMNLTAGSSKIGINLHSHTIKEICLQYDQSRKQHKKPYLKWRTKKSLGWIPFAKNTLIFKNNYFYFRKNKYNIWMSRIIPENSKICAGSFNTDSRGRWYLNVTIEVSENNLKLNKEIGIDLGIKNLVTCSDDTKYENPKYYIKYEEKLSRTQRANKKKQVKNIHNKIKNQRKDYLHKLSSKLTNENSLIVVGDVSSSKLTKTKLAKSVYDASWFSFKQMLSYKSIRNGGKYLEVNESYTTQICSNCGELPDSRPKGIADLGIREWTCSKCGVTHDRDVNAAKNILRLGRQALAEGA